MVQNDFRPRISDEAHRRLRLHYFDDDIDFSTIYENMAKMVFDEEGEKKEWYSRAEMLAEEEDVDVETAITSIVVSVLDGEGKFKPGAQQIYARNDSIGE